MSASRFESIRMNLVNILWSLDMMGQFGESSSVEVCPPPDLPKFLCITELRNALVVCSSFSLVLLRWYLSCHVAVGWLWSTVSWPLILPSPLLLETLSKSQQETGDWRDTSAGASRTLQYLCMSSSGLLTWDSGAFPTHSCCHTQPPVSNISALYPSA